MALFYKHFKILRTVFCLCFLYIPAKATLAAEGLFTIENVKVDITAKNAMAAREEAFNRAQIQAFEELAQRVTTETYGVSSIDVPSPRVISSLIQDFEVTDEKLSAVRYIGTYTFRFKGKAVREYFSRQGVAYTDVASKRVLVLPFTQGLDGHTVLWSPYNVWLKAWHRSKNLGGLVPLIVPLGDLDDVRDVNDDEALTYNKERLMSLLNRYGAGEAVVAVAVPDESLARSSGTQAPASGVLTVNLYRTDRTGPEYVQQIVEVARPGQSLSDLYDRAVRKVHRALQQDWKQKTLVEPRHSSLIHVRVNFESLEEWTATHRALERVQGIDSMVLQSLSPKTARIDLIFKGSEHRLRLALEQADMTLRNPGPEGWRAPAVYELYLNRYAQGRGG